MLRIADYIRQSDILKNVAHLLSANIVAQVIGLAVYPILTRIYLPEDFGLLQLFLSIGGILCLLATAEYQYAIVLPKEDEDARGVFCLGLTVLVIFSAVVGFSTFFSNSIANVFKAQGLLIWYRLMPVYVLIIGLWSLLSFYYIRKKRFKRIAGYQIGQSVFSAAGKTGLGFVSHLNGGLIIATVSAPLISLLMVLFPFKLFKDFPKRRTLFRLARKYRNFPLYSLPKSLLNNFGGNLPVLILTPFFGLAETGFLGMALTLAFRPINMICSSVNQVLYQNVSEKVNRRESIAGLLGKYVRNTGIVAVAVFALSVVILPSFTALLLGEEWRITGHYIQILLPWLLFVLLNTSINFLPDIFGRQRTCLFFEIAYVLLRLLSLWVGIKTGFMDGAVILFSAVGAAVLLTEMIWFYRMVRIYEREIEIC